MWRLASLLLAAFALTPPAGAQTLPPRDECGANAEFARFRADLLDIIVRRDRARLLAILSDDIRFSFGSEVGDHDFAAEWGLATPETSGLWTALANTLVLGCARDDGRMVSPYLFSRMPGGVDPYFSGVARPGARLSAARSDEGEGPLISWAIIEEVADEADGWSRVRLADGRSGYVESGEVLRTLDYRAIFERRNGRWLMTAFIAGD